MLPTIGAYTGQDVGRWPEGTSASGAVATVPYRSGVMRQSTRWLALAAGVVAIVVLFIVLSPGDGGGPKSTGEPITIRASLRGDTVEAPDRPTAHVGDAVVIVVTADASDEVHVHGYDLMADVTPDEPATIRFIADVAGVFEVELEDAGRALFQLEVLP